ncbi:hypothetical protein [uncultured Gammaproteobacteria bacterium]|nr:hypothetical protein [uncultured Gammaproteobacteria bacterium]
MSLILITPCLPRVICSAISNIFLSDKSINSCNSMSFGW